MVELCQEDAEADLVGISEQDDRVAGRQILEEVVLPTALGQHALRGTRGGKKHRWPLEVSGFEGFSIYGKTPWCFSPESGAW